MQVTVNWQPEARAQLHRCQPLWQFPTGGSMAAVPSHSRSMVAVTSKSAVFVFEFDPAAIRRLKAESEHDISVDGPELAAQAIAAGLVDELQPIVCPVLVGGGKRFFPDGVRLDLALLQARPFSSGVVVMRYATRR